MVAKPKQRRMWPWVLALVGVAGGVYATTKRPTETLQKVDTAMVHTVRRGELLVEVVETGKVQPRERVEVKSKIAGQVDRVFVEEGQAVKKGDPLLQLDPTDIRREVARSEAEVAQAKNAIAYATLMLDRKLRGLAERGVAQIDVDMATNELKMKKVALQSAEVAQAAALDRLRYTRIIAPIDGTVIQRGIQLGEVVTPGVQATFEGKPLLTIGDLSTLIVKADFNQIDVARISVGQAVTITLDALPGRTFNGKVTRIAPASQTPKGRDVEVFPIEAVVEGDPTGVRPGMTADLRVHLEKKAGVLSVPLEAVVKDKASGKSTVTRILSLEGGRAKTDKAVVRTGSRSDTAVEIVDGLKEGERILIRPDSADENEYKM